MGSLYCIFLLLFEIGMGIVRIKYYVVIKVVWKFVLLNFCKILGKVCNMFGNYIGILIFLVFCINFGFDFKY